MNTLGILAAAVLSLNGEWSMKAFPQPDDGAVRALPLPAGLQVKEYRATVPGCCEMELVKTGELADPRVGFNAFKFRAYEGHQWLYSRRFTLPARVPGERVMLCFDGIDTLADVSNALTDYYGEKKVAYAALKASYQSVLVMIAEDGRVLALNETLKVVKGHAKIVEAKDGKTVFEGDFEVGPNGRAEVAKLAWNGQGLFRIAWTSDGGDGANHYLHGEPPFAWADYHAWTIEERKTK